MSGWSTNAAVLAFQNQMLLLPLHVQTCNEANEPSKFQLLLRCCSCCKLQLPALRSVSVTALLCSPSHSHTDGTADECRSSGSAG